MFSYYSAFIFQKEFYLYERPGLAAWTLIKFIYRNSVHYIFLRCQVRFWVSYLMEYDHGHGAPCCAAASSGLSRSQNWKKLHFIISKRSAHC